MSTLSVDTIQGQTTAANVKLPAGCVLQTVSANGPNSLVSFTGNTYTDINLSATITPKYATSKILVKFNFVNATNTGSSGSYQNNARILRGSTGIYEVVRSPWVNPASGAGQLMHMEYMDSPSTTSATTYKVQLRNGSGSGNVSAHMGNSNAQVILMEIAQ
tara:strand:- start:549 stop:1031 length:483 start_codon:yes stop_codon:yes gene_type:complete